jgi:hypothetical protein
MGAQGNPNPVATAPYAGGGSGTMTMGGRTIDVETASKPWYNATDITGTADPNVPGWDDLWI